ncbi:MAG: hypothetical protein K0R18_77 [Bacillales bacterium]|jgi:hypothetical protein|nr:hypothetical protein [Bacillales bacterium]
MGQVVKYQCIQCEVVHEGTETKVPTCIFCNTSERMKALEEQKMYQIVIDYGHDSSDVFIANEAAKRKIQVAFKLGEKITLEFWKEELDINMEFVQNIKYELLSPKKISSFESTMIKNLNKYDVAFNKRRVTEDWV